MTRVIGGSGARSVTVDCWGNPNGLPAFLLHGTPSSGSGTVPYPSSLYPLGIWLISYDRPGYGCSDRHTGCTVAGAVWDVLAIADDLRLAKFNVVGRSGDAPHALACATNTPEKRLRSVAVLVGLAPSDARDLNWYNGMTRSNLGSSELVRTGTAVKEDVTERGEDRRRPDEAAYGSALADALNCWRP